MSARGSSRPIPWTALALIAALLLWALRGVLILVGFAALLAYALDPLVSALERVRLPRLPAVPRALAAALVMLALVALGAWGVGLAAPRLASELGRFVESLPANLERLAASARAYAWQHGLAGWLDGAEGGPMDAAGLLRQLGGTLASAAGRIFGGLGRMLGFVLVPVLAYYLLAEREAVQSSVLRFLPEDSRDHTLRLFAAVDRALRSYVRGQSVVCLTMGVITGLVLQLIGFPVALLLAVIVGIAEVVPFLGFWTAALAIGLTGYGVSPALAAGGVIAYALVNQAVGLLVTPRVMGRHMKMHPFVIMVSILAGGTLLGAGGAILALPAAAALQSLIAEFAARPGAAPSRPAAGSAGA